MAKKVGRPKKEPKTKIVKVEVEEYRPMYTLFSLFAIIIGFCMVWVSIRLGPHVSLFIDILAMYVVVICGSAIATFGVIKIFEPTQIVEKEVEVKI